MRRNRYKLKINGQFQEAGSAAALAATKKTQSHLAPEQDKFSDFYNPAKLFSPTL